MNTPLPSPRRLKTAETPRKDDTDRESVTSKGYQSDNESIAPDFLDKIKGGEFDYGEYAADYVKVMYDESTLTTNTSSSGSEGDSEQESGETSGSESDVESESNYPSTSWPYISKEIQKEMQEMHNVLSKFGLLPKRIAKSYPIENYGEQVPQLESCDSKDFLDYYVFPTLLPAIQSLLFYAKKNRIFQCGRCAFNPLDYIVEFLYNNNPMHPERIKDPTPLGQIPFAKAWLEKYPRPALPMSMTMTEEEAAITIQRFMRAYMVRKGQDVQEMRQFWIDIRRDKAQMEEDAGRERIVQESQELFSPYYAELIKSGGQSSNHSERSLTGTRATHSDKCLICLQFRNDLIAKKSEENKPGRGSSNIKKERSD